MDIYHSKIKKLPGSKYSEIYPVANRIYKQIASKTKRRPYVRSIYFRGGKVFLDYFWQHLRQKHLNDRVRRLAFYTCALDLIRYNKIKPVSKINPNRRSEIFHRFMGISRNKESFCVQIKEDIIKHEKYFMSAFPFT